MIALRFVRLKFLGGGRKRNLPLERLDVVARVRDANKIRSNHFWNRFKYLDFANRIAGSRFIGSFLFRLFGHLRISVDCGGDRGADGGRYSYEINCDVHSTLFLTVFALIQRHERPERRIIFPRK